ncbi:MAG TPA: NADH-quinone oxidoreductase subunit NuoE [Geminicoccaceae bacterium]|nr:NADH-quinone oxidoreductase subunit NuoE [Geminicoccaceae bacterium]
MSPAPVSSEANFRFTPENDALAKAIVARYPPGRQASAVLALLALAQEQGGSWLPQPALDYVADYLDMPAIRVYEVASFYDMFNTRPVGRIQIRVCTTTPCQLCGSDGVLAACEETLGIRVGQSTGDGRFFLREFECLGACANAPVLWIDDDFYEDLTYDSTKAIIQALMRGERPRPGSQTGRKASMPANGKTTLREDLHRGGKRGKKEGPGKRDEEPVEKAKPETEVKGHAAKVEKEGRPADGAGDQNLAEPKDPDAR